MNSDKKWRFVFERLREIQVQSDRLSEATDGLLVAPESPLLDCASRLGCSLLQSLSLIVGDWGENLAWYAYECDYGREPKEAGLKGNMQLIDSHKKLRWLIELVV